MGTEISAKTAKKKSWMTYADYTGGWEVTFDDLSMGNATEDTINKAFHNSANTVTNEWTNGTTATSLDASVQT